MTVVEYVRRGDQHTLTVTGHAGYAADGGPDVVCAAVSALCCTLLQCLTDMRAEGALAWLDYRQGCGDVEVTVRGYLATRDKVETVIRVAVTGLSMLAGKYPGCVRVVCPLFPSPNKAAVT